MPHSDDIFGSAAADIKERSTPARALLAVFFCFVVVGAVFLIGEVVQRTTYYGTVRSPELEARMPSVRNNLRNNLRDIVHNTIPEVRPPWYRDGLLNSGLPVYDLRIEDEDDLKYLYDTAEKVMAVGHSDGISPEYVSADFLLDGKWVPIKVKLRGYTSQHYRKRIASLRLNFPKTQLFNGKEQINLSATYDKGLTADITANWALSKYDIMTWDNDFVVLRLNGEVAAMYQEIEQFDRSISDRHRRAEGFIFAGHGQLFGPQGLGYTKALEALSLLEPCYIAEGADVPEQCDWDFFSTYFDVDKLAWAAAMTVVLNSSHAWVDDNLRLFWDPARGKFEPIPWDYLYYAIDTDLYPEGEHVVQGYRYSLYNIPEFRRLRDQRVWDLLTNRVDEMIEYSNAAFESIKTALSYDLRHLTLAEDIERHNRYTSTLQQNRSSLEKLYEQQKVTATAWPGADEALVIEIQNHGKAFIEIKQLEFVTDGKAVKRHFDAPLIVDGYWQGQPGRLVVEVPDVGHDAALAALQARNGVTGEGLLAESIAFNRGSAAPADFKLAEQDMVKETFDLDIRGVEIAGSDIVFGPGVVRLDQSVTIPRSHNVVFKPGLDLRVAENVSLVIYGDLASQGTESDPIQIGGLTSDQSWGGIFVQGIRTDPSIVTIDYTNVTGGYGGESERSFFTSPFSVHDGVVTMRNSAFRNAGAEDGINLKYAQVDIDSIAISGSASDSVDCDFCRGTIVGSHVNNSGGDGLDFSGSNVTLRNNEIENCADKGISVGENTVADITGTVVSDCYIGIAIKDLSAVTIDGAQFRDLEVGIAMYVKKQTFGPGEAIVRNVSTSNVETRYLHDGASKLTIVTPDEYDRQLATSDRSGTITVH